MAREHKDEYGLNRALRALNLAKSVWYYTERRQGYEEKYSYLMLPLLEIARAHPE